MRSLTVFAIAAALCTSCKPGTPAVCNSGIYQNDDGSCFAHYSQVTTFGYNKKTDAKVSCSFSEPGSSYTFAEIVVAFDSSESGILFNWIDDRSLEIGIPQSAHVTTQKKTMRYRDRVIHLTYRPYRPDELVGDNCGVRAAPSNNSFKPKPLRGSA